MTTTAVPAADTGSPYEKTAVEAGLIRNRVKFAAAALDVPEAEVAPLLNASDWAIEHSSKYCNLLRKFARNRGVSLDWLVVGDVAVLLKYSAPLLRAEDRNSVESVSNDATLIEPAPADPAVAAVAVWVRLEAARDAAVEPCSGLDDPAAAAAAWTARAAACETVATTLAGLAAQLVLAVCLVGQLEPDSDFSDPDVFAAGEWHWRDNIDGVLLRNMLATARTLAAA